MADETVDEVQSHAFSPLQQRSNIPLQWKPTVDKPVPVVRCVVIKKDGDRCGRWSVRGHTKCWVHGHGEMNFPNVKARVDAILESARMRLIDDSDAAVETLENLMQPGTAEGIRLKAATEILDRAGIRGGFEIDVEVESKSDPAEILTNRLRVLRERGMAAQQQIDDGAYGYTVQGEVVSSEDEAMPGQETLF